MLFHHDDIDSLRVLERKETKTTGTTSGTITHDRTLSNLAKLGEVVT